MGALARLSATTAEVVPGEQASLELTVRNTGTVVDQFNFEVLGDAARWTTVEPPTVSLFPQGEQTVQVSFGPPRSPSTPAGAVPFGVRAASQEDPDGSVVEEGTITVAPFSEVVAEVTPRAVRARLRGEQVVLVDNRSNIAYQAELAAADGDEAYEFFFKPPLVDVAPGTVAFAKLTSRPKQRYWRGPSITKPFQVVARQQQAMGADPAAGTPPPPPSGPHPAEVMADAAIVQDPLLPAWLAKALMAVAAVILLLALAWFALVKPQITAAAQNQVNKAIKPLTQEVKRLASQGAPPTTAPPPTTTPPPTTSPVTTSPVTTVPGKGRRTTTTTGAPPKRTTTTRALPLVTGTPINDSLIAPGNNRTVQYNVPARKTLEVTDILLENSAGASGNIYLERNGTVLMSWALANFRDLDYHWITPVYFDSRQHMQLSVRDCTGRCTPSLYFAGTLTSSK